MQEEASISGQDDLEGLAKSAPNLPRHLQRKVSKKVDFLERVAKSSLSAKSSIRKKGRLVILSPIT